MLNAIERFPILNVLPTFERGRFDAKVIENEVFSITATVFREGHSKVGANAVLVNPDGKEFRFQMSETNSGRDEFSTLVQVQEVGIWKFYVESWSDDFHSWEHKAKIKIENNQDIELTFEEGSIIFANWQKQISKAEYKRELKKISEDLINSSLTPDNRLELSTSEYIHQVWNEFPYRELISKSEVFELDVRRARSSFCSWYQFFPRSEGAKKLKSGVKSGNFKTATKRLAAVKEMGFDVIYIPPIHPIGLTNRKGKNNELKAKADDPGSPWAVGGKLANGELGGHYSIHPDLGTEDDFKDFVSEAKRLDLEVSLDIALQCSPDHPWVKEHKEWFTVLPDSSIAYAENPPKKYQDIYPLNFDNDPEGLVNEILKLLEYWINLGVTVLRIDNPHTKPVWVWQFLIQEVKKRHPEVIWLAEAFTKPNMMRTLGLVGFDQSHSYFLWRNNKQELEQFFNEISSTEGFWYKASLWPTTPDNLTDYLADGGEAAHAIRAILAALGSTSWGIYAGYEFVEDKQRQNKDGSFALEHINSEKYQITVRDWKLVDKVSGITKLITSLNRIRNSHISCQNIHSLKTHTTNNDDILCFSRHIPARFTKDNQDDTLIVIINLNPKRANQATVYFDYSALNLPEQFKVVDELTGRKFDFSREVYVDLAPVKDVAHILRVVRK